MKRVLKVGSFRCEFFLEFGEVFTLYATNFEVELKDYDKQVHISIDLSNNLTGYEGLNTFIDCKNLENNISKLNDIKMTETRLIEKFQSIYLKDLNLKDMFCNLALIIKDSKHILSIRLESIKDYISLIIIKD